MSSCILIVDDDDLVLQSLKLVLQGCGYKVKTASSAIKALELLDKLEFDLVITDMKMPKMAGLNFLEAIKNRWPQLPVIMITAYATVETAVDAMKKGAFDYIMKPFSADEIEILVKRALESSKLKKENVKLKQVIEDELKSDFVIVGEHPRMKELMELVKRVAKTDATVLIQGETGTGKELIAKAIHLFSKRGKAPYIKMNCAALPESLIEAELFGYEKGAFTGAVQRRLGKFELANTGTILLDEVSEMPIHLQAKLLRVLQEKELDRLGSGHPVKVDVRVIASTNRDLLEEVKKGNFRQDLFYRLNVVPIYVPPLRERKEDIPLLARYFLQRYARQVGKNICDFSSEALDLLIDYTWPGNVRELENCIHRSVILCDSDIIGREDISLSYCKVEF